MMQLRAAEGLPRRSSCIATSGPEHAWASPRRPEGMTQAAAQAAPGGRVPYVHDVRYLMLMLQLVHCAQGTSTGHSGLA